jgi:hypothetical protein
MRQAFIVTAIMLPHPIIVAAFAVWVFIRLFVLTTRLGTTLLSVDQDYF